MTVKLKSTCKRKPPTLIIMLSKSILILSTFLIMSIATDTKRAKRLFNGNDVEPDEYPFTVSILLNNTHICVGITIGEKHILTAAHCFGNLPLVALANLVVRSGSIFYNSGGNLHSVKKIIYHREYRIGDTTSPNDIAILELNNPITLDDHCKIISLSSTFVQTGAIATVIGWGHTESLRKTNPSLKQLTLTILDPLTCQAYMPYTMYIHQICAIGFLNQGTCVGDSGGPLVWNRQLIGLVSYGIPCATGHPDVFTSIPSYIPWITEVMAQ